MAIITVALALLIVVSCAPAGNASSRRGRFHSAHAQGTPSHHDLEHHAEHDHGHPPLDHHGHMEHGHSGHGHGHVEHGTHIHSQGGRGHAHPERPVQSGTQHHHHYHAPVHVHNYRDSGESSEEDSSEESSEESSEDSSEGGVEGGSEDLDSSEDNGGDDIESDNDKAASDEDDRIWTFQVGDYFGPWEYIDDEGYIKGFNIDLIQAVCRVAGKRCHFLFDTYRNCWDASGEIQLPGVGLLDGWYDGCVGLFVSPERLNSFNFTLPFTPNFAVALHYRAGEIPLRPYNLTGRKIGFIKGWAVGKECLARQRDFSGNQPGEYIPVMYNTHKEMIIGLRAGEVDALLGVDAFDAAKRHQMGMEAIEPWFSCTTQGSSVMARYGSPMIDWWNAAFQTLVDSGEFSTLCARAKDIHGSHGTLFCLGDEN